MLMTELLDHDLHRSRGGTPVPLNLHIPIPKECYPSVVSSSRGRFFVAKGPQKDTGMAMTGVFDYDSDKLDALLGPMLTVAFGLSVGSSYQSLKRVQRRVFGRLVSAPMEETVAGTFKNSFVGKGAARAAFEHVQQSSGLKFQPHVCLVPSSWDEKAALAFFGKKDYEPDKRKFSKCCRVIFHDVPMPVFFSRPDMVGMYSQFMNGGASVILHNVELGLAFCPQG